jgi:hypothetical protein
VLKLSLACSIRASCASRGAIALKSAFAEMQQKRLGRRDTALDTGFADGHHLPEHGLVGCFPMTPARTTAWITALTFRKARRSPFTSVSVPLNALWRNIMWISKASIIEPTVPAAAPPPIGPGHVIALLTVWITRFPRRTVDALAGARLTLRSHYGANHKGKSYGCAENLKFHRVLLNDPFEIVARRVSSFNGCDPDRDCGVHILKIVFQSQYSARTSAR